MVRMEPADAAQRIAVFGSVLALTWPPDLASATFLVEGNRFIEATSAPSFDEDTYELLTKKPRWGKSLRMLACGPYGPSVRDVEVKKLVGGFLLQERDPTAEAVAQLEAVTKKKPTAAQQAELAFANRIAKHVKSNPIVLTQDRTVVGVGAGQMSRVDSVDRRGVPMVSTGARHFRH